MSIPLVVDYRETTIEQSGNVVLDSVNFDLAQAEMCYIIGKSGSGKSSLLNSIYGEAIIKSGEAKVLDYDLRKIKEPRYPILGGGWAWYFRIFTSLSNGLLHIICPL